MTKKTEKADDVKVNLKNRDINAKEIMMLIIKIIMPLMSKNIVTLMILKTHVSDKNLTKNQEKAYRGGLI